MQYIFDVGPAKLGVHTEVRIDAASLAGVDSTGLGACVHQSGIPVGWPRLEALSDDAKASARSRLDGGGGGGGTEAETLALG